jgi:hypothetical protein
MSEMVSEPMTVWDGRECAYDRIREPAMEWLTAQGIPVDPAYRVEFFLVDSPFARVFTYAEDEQGRRYMDPATDDPAVNEPYVKVLSELPPAELRLPR